MDSVIPGQLAAGLVGWALTGLIALITMLVVLVVYWSVLALVHRVARSQAPLRIFLDASPRALAAAAVLIALQAVWHTAQSDLYLLDTVQHLTTLALILALTWTGIGYT